MKTDKNWTAMVDDIERFAEQNITKFRKVIKAAHKGPEQATAALVKHFEVDEAMARVAVNLSLTMFGQGRADAAATRERLEYLKQLAEATPVQRMSLEDARRYSKMKGGK